MHESPELLLTSDPKAFMAVVQDESAHNRVQSLHTLDDMMTCEALRHGIFDVPAALPSLRQFYNEIFLQAPVERRKEIYGHVARIVPQLGSWTAGAITPFIFLDPDIGIVSTATIDYTSIGSRFDDDPLGRPKDVITILNANVPVNPAAVIGGLFALGDPRVCNLLRPLRATLTVDEVTTVTKCFSGLTAKCMVDFYLDWLEELVDRTDYDSEEKFGHVAAGLHRLASARTRPFIADGLRPFPVPTDGTAQWPSIRIHPQQFAESIAPVLFSLERRERAPKVLPHTIRAFGLTPQSAPNDIYAL